MTHLPPNRISCLLRVVAACAIMVALAARIPAQVSDQSASPSGGDQTGQDQIVRMGTFEVRTTKGIGYTAGNSDTAMKNNQALMDIPQNIIEITNDLINDIGEVASTDIVQYAGAATAFEGEAPSIRGNRIGYPSTDDMPDAVTYSDDADIDTYEIIKGPVQIFYPGSSLGGIILKTSKKPLPYDYASITGRIDQWGGDRLVLDVTGPVGTLGEGKLGYRFVAAFQGGTMYDRNVRNDHKAVFPTLEWDWHNTSVVLEWNGQIVYQPDSYNGFLTPSGALYTGAGWRNWGQAPNSNVKFASRSLRGIWIQKMSEGWDSKLAAQVSNLNRSGAEQYPGSINYRNNTLTYQPFLNGEWASYVTVQDDISGRYNVLTIPNVTSFGFVVQDNLVIQNYVVGPVTPADTIPLGSGGAINSVQVPQASLGQWVFPANQGSRNKTDVYQAYAMQQIDLIPNWLSLVGGFTFSDTEDVNDPNIGIKGPYAATDLDGHALLHRLGVLLHVTKEVMIYGAESTNYNASAGVDYNNNPLPPVLGKDDEVGFKTSFFNGRLSSTVSIFKMALSNQAIVESYTLTNVAGQIFETPIGTTTTRGWDGNLTFSVMPGWQLIATAYNGTVRNTAGQPVQNTYGNSWSLFTRYDFAKESALRGIGFGGGVTRIGDTLVSSGGITPPAGFVLPSLLKLDEGTLVKVFATYQPSKHWLFRLGLDNVLNKAFPLGQQGATNIDPSLPRTLNFTVTYSF